MNIIFCSSFFGQYMNKPIFYNNLILHIIAALQFRILTHLFNRFSIEDEQIRHTGLRPAVGGGVEEGPNNSFIFRNHHLESFRSFI